MKKSLHPINLFVALFILFNCLGLTSNGQNIEWAKGIGGNDIDQSNAIACDNSGNVYITGSFKGTVDFDPGSGNAMLTSNGATDIYFAKYDPNGDILWVKSIGGSSDDEGQAVGVDSNGDVYIAGSHSSGTIDFDPGSGSANITGNAGGGFLAKYDDNGNYLWVKSFKGGNGASISVRSVAFDPFDQVVITGFFFSINSGSVDFNPGITGGDLTSIGIGNLFLAKYASDGDYQWATNIGSNYLLNVAADVAIDGVGNIYQTGFFGDAVSESNGPTLMQSNGGSDIFLSKYDSTGSLLWINGIGGTENDEGASIAVDANGYLYLTGGFRDTVNFDPVSQSDPLIAKGGLDLFIAKYDTSGKFIWANGIGGSHNDYGYAIATDTSDNLYVTGTLRDTVDFDPGNDTTILLGHHSNNGAVFVANYDSSGGYVWAGASQGHSNSTSQALALGSGYIYVTGMFEGTVDLDFSMVDTTQVSSNGTDDIFLFKINENGCAKNGTAFSEVACDSFMFNGVTYHSSGRYVDTFVNATNCDSFVILDLTLKQSTSNPVVDGHYCDSVTFNGINYTTSGVYTQQYTNFSGCDSSISYDITITPSSHNTIIEIACDSFSFEDTTYTISGIYTHFFVSEVGCDSIVNIDLTINNTPEISVIQSGTTLIASVSTGDAEHYQWIDCADNTIILGEEGQQFTPTTSGDYAVMVIDDDCTDTSDCVSVKVEESSISKINPDQGLSVYPNPTGLQLHIQSTFSLKDANLRLINNLGKVLIERRHLNGRHFTLDLHTLTPGVYFMEILDEGKEVIRKKVVKAVP